MNAVARFNRLNMHDFNLRMMNVCVSRSERVSSKNCSYDVYLWIEPFSGSRPFRLQFKRCRNLFVSVDFDVLKMNSFAQIARNVASTEFDVISGRIFACRASWFPAVIDEEEGAEVYRSNSPEGIAQSEFVWDRPLRKKLSSSARIVSFKFQLFGGSIEILSGGFQKVRLDNIGASMPEPLT